MNITFLSYYLLYEWHLWYIVFHWVLNLNVELHEDGTSDAETCRSDTIAYFVYLKGVFVGVMNEQFVTSNSNGQVK